jgi:hypothetical protein
MIEIEELLQTNKRSLRDYHGVPYPVGYVRNYVGNKLIHAQLNYDTNLLRKEFLQNFASLTGNSFNIIYANIHYYIRIFLRKY